MTKKFQRYEYLLVDDKHTYKGSYTIIEGTKPLGFKNEKLIDTFDANVK